MPDGTFDANMEACCGCGVCEAVCPVEDCITMVNEAAFEDNASQWEMWRKDKAAYKTWLTAKIGDKTHDRPLARLPLPRPVRGGAQAGPRHGRRRDHGGHPRRERRSTRRSREDETHGSRDQGRARPSADDKELLISGQRGRAPRR